MSTTAWIKAARPRTLPLAISGILVGGGLAQFTHPISDFWPLFGLLVLTAILLQVLSNFANDYGDFKKGTDNENRVGPKRALQSGDITPGSMRLVLILTGILCLVSGISALYMRAGDALFSLQYLVFIGLGLVAIWAAIQYTVGKTAYGYRGLGDVFVFVFFGLVAVGGTYWLLTQEFYLNVLLPAGSIGAFSVAVLNLNNMRDIANDKASGKRTIPVQIGLENAKTYHAGLLLVGWVLITLTYLFVFSRPVHLIWFATAAVFVPHVKKVIATDVPTEFDPELKKVALASFGFAILFFASSFIP